MPPNMKKWPVILAVLAFVIGGVAIAAPVPNAGTQGATIVTEAALDLPLAMAVALASPQTWADEPNIFNAAPAAAEAALQSQPVANTDEQKYSQSALDLRADQNYDAAMFVNNETENGGLIGRPGTAPTFANDPLNADVVFAIMRYGNTRTALDQIRV